MPRPTRGTTYPVKGGVGIRWQHDGIRGRNQVRFATKPQPTTGSMSTSRRGSVAAARRPTSPSNVLRRLPGPVGCRSVRPDRSTVTEWLAPARAKFGRWTLAELEGAADDISRWRAKLPTEHARYKHTRAIRQVLAAAKRWGYSIAIQPRTWVRTRSRAQTRSNRSPRRRSWRSAPSWQIGHADAAIVIFGRETGLRTNELVALERRDIDRRATVPIVSVARRFAHGRPTPYPKTERRAVPLTPVALAALDSMVVRMDTPVLFRTVRRSAQPQQLGQSDLDTALKAAGVSQRGPYHLRHTFATEALRGGVSIFDLSRLMGASVTTIERHYGHLAQDSLGALYGLLSDRSAHVVPMADSETT